MNSRAMTRGLGLAAAIAVVSTLAAPAFAAPQQAPVKAAAPQAKAEDFNGDGYRDVVVSAASATVNGKAKAGYAAVLYGSQSASLTAKKQIINQDSAGITDVAEPGDHFGASVVTGDFDRDGYTDLAIGAPGEDVGQTVDAGSVTVVWGGKQGLAGSTLLKGVSDAAGAKGGGHLAAGDFNGDKAADLALSEGNGDIRQLSGPFTRDGAAARSTVVVDDFEGAVNILDLASGDIDGDGKTDLVRVYNHHGDSYYAFGTSYQLGSAHGLGAHKNLGGEPNAGNRFSGNHVAVGDVNGDSVADIVVGRTEWGSNIDGAVPNGKGGLITWIPGVKGKSPDLKKSRVLNQDTKDVPGDAEEYYDQRGTDQFGAGLSIGEVNGDKYADIAVGVPGEDLDKVNNAGSVVVLRGSKDGPTGKGSQLFSQNTKSVPDAAEKDDAFGLNNKLVDFNGDKKADLISAAPGENKNAGAIWVFKSTKTGLAAKGSVSINAGSLGATAGGGLLGGAFAN